MNQCSVSVVTGANSGIGRATAIHLASQGHVVYGTVRAESRKETLLAMAEEAGVEVRLAEIDVSDDVSVRRGFDTILADAGRVDVLVNNAGIGGNGVAEEATVQSYLEVMNVNLGGAIRCLQQVLPGMRDRGHGSIVNITSVAGRFAALAQSPYVASKFALEGVSEGLAQEVAPFGVRVIIIEPGVTRSAIFAKSSDSPNSSDAYQSAYRRMRQFYARGIASASDPLEVAKLVHHAITTNEPRLRYAISWGGAELIEGRSAMSDPDWVALGAIEDDADYYERFAELFGLDIRPQ
jgi:NAD(P)-dependent dehydrogenase (short-subunit alcohol dehydrogenase family)